MLTQFLNSADMAIKALVSNKMRSLLTMLGLIIGVGSVVTLTAIGQGASQAVASRINAMGTNLLQIDPAPTNFGGVSGGGSSVHLTEKDLPALKRSPYLTAVEPSVDTRIQAIGGNSNWPTRLLGTTPVCMSIRNYILATGVPFTDADTRSGKKVCLLGKTVARNLFGNDTDPIGKEVRLGSVPLTVIGVLIEKGPSANGQDQDDIIIAPLATVQKRIKGTTYLDDIFVTTASATTTEAAITDITSILRLTHKIASSNTNDFRIRSQVEIAQATEKSTDTLTNLLRSAAIIALLVGGIGIMNIMLVSVTERTREIGIRKSIGAKSFNILSQFLTEALALSLVGGIVGVISGYIASSVISAQNGWVLIISPAAVALSFGAASAVGLFFGFYPARKAARLDPIVALRHE
ncbi:MAG TPA: ABC transporter permease [Candidatus Kapabacteria bacterium]|nr:ABC transporter permease [Candidatus Kapabacteria bacterium]